MANRLLRYEAGLFRRSFAIAFGRRRDALLLFVMLLLGAAWLRTQIMAGGWALPPEALWLGALAGPTALAWQRLVRARLDWLVEQSPLAADALDRRSRCAYVLASHVAAAAPIALGATVLATTTGRPATAVAITTLAYAAGAGLAWIPRSPGTSRREIRSIGSIPPGPRGSKSRGAAAFRAVIRRQALNAANPGRAAALILAATFGLAVAAAWIAADRPDAVRFAVIACPSLLALLLISRLDAELIGFLPFAGYRPVFLAAAVSALPAAAFGATAAALLAFRPRDWLVMLAALALIHLATILFIVARAWLYPGRNPRSADLQVELEFASLAGILFILPPLAPIALAWRTWMLRRRYRALMWVQL
ncbi:MAG TPA: hypothetical protein VF603_00220 [Allosphingosinicella sp.]|jgi:hypothetical protein